jgi:hypothetical protein
MASPVFAKMASSHFKEDAKNEIELPGKKLEDILDLLETIYPNFSRILDGKLLKSFYGFVYL